MKLTKALLGHGFGELAYLRGIVTYKLSPFELRAFGGFFKSINRTVYRIASSAPFVVPPLAIGYLVYSEVEKKFHQMCRKNPQDYINDK